MYINGNVFSAFKVFLKICFQEAIKLKQDCLKTIIISTKVTLVHLTIAKTKELMFLRLFEV